MIPELFQFSKFHCTRISPKPNLRKDPRQPNHLEISYVALIVQVPYLMKDNKSLSFFRLYFIAPPGFRMDKHF
jgi:hypothetical protein